MQPRVIGIILIVIGIIMLVYNGFNFVTHKKVVDLGPLEINKEEKHNVSWPPIVGAVLIVGGIVVLARDKKAGA
jgi:uncharacterized membrane protein YdcZ (DUF606 family)